MKDEHHKLSKRNGDASFFDLVDKGYLPEAILNYIALLGWSPSVNEEFFTLKELEQNFSISGISRSPSIFDIEKLSWMNGEYIRRMDDDAFVKLAEPCISAVLTDKATPALVQKLALLIKPRINILSEIPDKIGFLAELPDYSTEIYVHKKMKTDEAVSLEALKLLSDSLGERPDFAQDGFVSQELYEYLCGLAAEHGLKNSQILWPLRTAVSGLAATPGGATELAEILGYDETMRRIGDGIRRLEESAASGN